MASLNSEVYQKQSSNWITLQKLQSATSTKKYNNVEFDLASLKSDSRSLNSNKDILIPKETAKFIKIESFDIRTKKDKKPKKLLKKRLTVASESGSCQRFLKTKKYVRMKTKYGKSIRPSKPPLMPKNPLWTEIKLKDDLKYIWRLNTHLTKQEINERLIFQNNQRIECNSFVVQRPLCSPDITAKDVYDKVVYDFVRRDVQKSKKIKEEGSVDNK